MPRAARPNRSPMRVERPGLKPRRLRVEVALDVEISPDDYVYEIANGHRKKVLPYLRDRVLARVAEAEKRQAEERSDDE